MLSIVSYTKIAIRQTKCPEELKLEKSMNDISLITGPNYKCCPLPKMHKKFHSTEQNDYQS